MERIELVKKIIDKVGSSFNNLMVFAHMTDEEILQTYNELYNIK